MILVAAVVALVAPPVRACTIFVLTDAKHALFCNNEDWPNPNTRIWFQPAGKGYYGAVYVGFDNGWGQGGLNSEGLAYDWVMTSPIPQKWEPDLPSTHGRSCQRMLETCATVKDAIAFYRTYAEPSFSTSRLMVADKTGASVIIGVKDGHLEVEESNQSRGFGFGGRSRLASALAHRAALANPPETTVAEGFEILHDCRQAGQYATKYSNIVDLKSGDIFLRVFGDRTVEVRLNLAVELKKGGHYYEMPALPAQLAQASRPLPRYMRRFPLDEYKPIPDKEPKVTAHVRAMLRDETQGTPRAEDFTADFWQAEVLPNLTRSLAEFKRLGEILSITLVEREEAYGLRSYRYRLEFANATGILHLVLDAQDKVTASSAEDLEWGPATKPPKPESP